MQDKHDILKTYFGYTAFRKGQEEMIDALLSGYDAVGIMPTGAGKSLCFQIPALLFSGITLVVSPLISLMKDQVGALRQSEVPAAFLNSALTPVQQRKVIENAQAGQYKIIYVAPERLFAQDFLSFAACANISLISIDEAHCVSQWGQDFRPGYLRIQEFIHVLPRRPVVGAFTATATEHVREDIVSLLGLRQPTVITTGFDRANLYFEVQSPKSKYAALEHFLRLRRDKSGIVYCLTRKTVEEICEKLCTQGYNATRYHAGLAALERKENQELFQTDGAKVMVATNAFGMGIDKSNVSFVVHYNMPKNMESYYQEAGRAGRDGSPAECLLLYSGQDVVTNQFFIDQSEVNEEMDATALLEFKRRERDRLKQMTFYCHTQDCLRAFILLYFGESAPNYCGNCSNCLRHFEKVDITVAAQKILSCVKRMNERYGIKLLVDTLRGLKHERIVQLGLDSLPTYGIMRDMNEKQLREMIGFLLADGCLVSAGDEFPVLHLGPNAKAVLFGNRKLSMNLSRDQAPKAAKKRMAADGVSNPRLYTKLQALRMQLAKAQSVPAYAVFPDSTLREMCAQLPQSEAELERISGVGQVKLKKYGKQFLSVICAEVADGDAEAAKTPQESDLAGNFDQYKQSLLAQGLGSVYEKWSEEEIATLKEEFNSGLSPEEISNLHGRTKGAIVSRLKKIGMLD